MVVDASKGLKNFASKVQEDLVRRFPSSERIIENLSIGRNKDSTVGNHGGYKMSSGIQKSGIYMACDSVVRPYVANARKTAFVVDEPVEVKRHIATAMDSLISAGRTEAQAKEIVKQSVVPMMSFNALEGQYHITPYVKGVNDSLLSNQSLPFWNIGYMQKVFKQPITPSFAKHLVSIEGFGNAWADAVSVFTETFEGYGRVSNVARGTVETTNSNPVSNAMGQRMTDVINIAVDYETSIDEGLRASQSGNFLTGIAMADRDQFAMMMLERVHDALILFGNTETGTEGLTDVAGEVAYVGTPLYSILTSAVITNKGSQMIAALNRVIGDFLRENHYMATALEISCSTFFMQAMTTAMYSDTYNPSSPMQVISGNFDAAQTVGGGLQSCKWTMVADAMLDPDTVYNEEHSDLFIMTIPSISAANGEQHGLVISPEVLKQFIVPAIYQRSGLLYTMYKRVGGIIAPIENTVKVIRGFGYAA